MERLIVFVGQVLRLRFAPLRMTTCRSPITNFGDSGNSGRPPLPACAGKAWGQGGGLVVSIWSIVVSE